MRLRSTRIRHCLSEGAGCDPARTNCRCGRTRAECLATDVLQAEVAPVACFRPVFSCYWTAIRGQPERRRSRSFPVVVAWLAGRSPASGCAPAPVFLLYFTEKTEASQVHAVSPALGADSNDLFVAEIDDLDAVAIGVASTRLEAGFLDQPSGVRSLFLQVAGKLFGSIENGLQPDFGYPRLTNAGSLPMRLMSSCNFSMIGLGVPAGATKPK